MDPDPKGEDIEQEELETHYELEQSTPSNNCKPSDQIYINIPSLQTRLLDQNTHPRRLLDFLRAHPSLEWLNSPFSIFRKAVHQRDEASRSVPSPAGIQRRFHMRFLRKIDWASLRNICKEWLKNPMNIALLIWLVCVGCFVSLLFLLMAGLVDHAFPTKALRNQWIETCNQVLNALFTLMSLYQHPILFHHLVLLCRWRSEDITALRKIYCKNGSYRPHEWAHMMVVVILLHVACFGQYTLCGLYWAYNSRERPEFADDFCVIVGLTAPVLAGVYIVYSPLGREYGPDSDEESQSSKKHGKLGLKVYDQRTLVTRPEWVGGLFSCKEDPMVAYLSLFCTCCVFGWNMERLGFGNMYVHMVTFLLLCIAPFWIFNISALNIHKDVIRTVVGISGMVLCLFGLLYGGFWRIQIRKRFKLPGSDLCCGSKSMTDYVQWMFCWACSLAQEVRTANFHDVEDDSLYKKGVDCGSESSLQVDSNPLIDSDLLQIEEPCSVDSQSSSSIGGRECSDDDTMVPPVQPLMVLDNRDPVGCTVALQGSSHIQREDSEQHADLIQDG